MKINFWNKLKFYFEVFSHSFFRGLKNADNITLTQRGGHDGGETEIIQGIIQNGPLSDIMEGKLTQQVKEFRDETYRVLKESDKYETDIEYDKEGNIVSAKAQKKKIGDFDTNHPPVLLHEDAKLRLIQDNRQIDTSKSSWVEEDVKDSRMDDYEMTIKMTWDGFTPRVRIEKYISKIVVHNISDKKARIDLYTSIYASQFGKVDAIVKAEIARVFKKEEKVPDFLQFSSLDFYADRAWNAHNLTYFKYDNISFDKIEIFDGNYVIEFIGDIIADEEDITKKYEMESVTEKYIKETPKSDATDMMALFRKINKDNDINGFENVKLKIK